MGLVVLRATNIRGARTAAFRIALLQPPVLFLELPESAEWPVNEFLRYGDREIIDSHPSELVRVSTRPHIRFLSELRRRGYRGEVRCVVDNGALERELEIASEASRLTLRYMLTGRVELDRWRDLLRRAVDVEPSGSVMGLLEAVADAGEPWAAVLNVWRMRRLRPLKETGVAEVVVCGLPACRSPLDEMVLLERFRKLTDERLRVLVEEHAEFVRTVQVSPDLETAYEVWTERCLGRLFVL
jgi:hypothetical protein